MQESIGNVEKALRASDTLFEVNGYGPDSHVRSQIAKAFVDLKKIKARYALEAEGLPYNCIECNLPLPAHNMCGICTQCIITHDF